MEAEAAATSATSAVVVEEAVVMEPKLALTASDVVVAEELKEAVQVLVHELNLPVVVEEEVEEEEPFVVSCSPSFGPSRAILLPPSAVSDTQLCARANYTRAQTSPCTPQHTHAQLSRCDAARTYFTDGGPSSHAKFEVASHLLVWGCCLPRVLWPSVMVLLAINLADEGCHCEMLGKGTFVSERYLWQWGAAGVVVLQWHPFRVFSGSVLIRETS
jgi:hypothetical protein